MTTPTAPRTTSHTPATTPSGDAALTRAGRASQAITGRGSATTPRRLRLARLAHVVVALVLGVGAVVAGAELTERSATAAVHAEQHTRAVLIENYLQDAQESANTPPDEGEILAEQTRAALDTAVSTLVELAGAETGDVRDLAFIGQELSRYAQALAAGKNAEAKEMLEASLLPAIRELQATHQAVSETAVAWWMWLVPVGAWLALPMIVGISWYTARVSRRLLNPGLVVAAVSTIVLAMRSGTVLSGHLLGVAPDAGFIVLAIATTAISAVAGAWGLHQRLKEYQ